MTDIDMSAVPPPAGPGSGSSAAPPPPAGDTKAKIVAALLGLAAERRWEDFSLTDVANRAGITLAQFRDHFPSKGAVLAAWSRQIDKQVLEGSSDDLIGEPAKERLFDVLMRRLDAMAPHKDALDGILEWTRHDPAAALALNGLAINSMRFMLEAAGIDSEGAVGALKLQGLVLAWTRVLRVWLDDRDPSQGETMAALDRELSRGETFVARAKDLDRIVSPLRALGQAVIAAGMRGIRAPGGRRGRTGSDRRDDYAAADPSI